MSSNYLLGEYDPKRLLWLVKTLEDQSRYNWTTIASANVTPNYNDEYFLINKGYLVLDSGLKDKIKNKDYSISLDVYPTQAVANSNYVVPVSLGGSNTVGGDVFFNHSSDSIIWYAGGPRIQKNNIGFSFNKWYHIEFMREGGLFKLLLDETLIGTSDFSVTNNAMDFYIGANQSAPSQETMIGYVKNIIVRLL